MTCTEPEIWKVVPDADAPDDVISAYLEHTGRCEYHADIERRRMMAVRISFDSARSLTSTGTLTFSDEEEAAVLGAAKKLEAFRKSDKKISSLSFKIEGQEIGNLKFGRWRSAKINIRTSKPLQIFGRAAADDPELMLGTYLPLGQKEAGSYILPITGGQALHFKVKPGPEESVAIKVSCLLLPQTHKPSWFEKFKLAPAPAQFALTGVVIILACGLATLAVLLYQFGGISVALNGSEVPPVAVGPLETPLPSPQPLPSIAPQVKPEPPFIAQNRGPNVDPLGRGTRAPSSIESRRLLREVKTIFIKVEGPTELGERILPGLQTALNSHVQLLTEAESSGADAHLIIRLTRRNNSIFVRADLVNEPGKIIWPAKGRASSYKQPLSDIETVGVQIGNNLSADITKARATKTQP